MIPRDTLWKGAIEDFFENFLHFFYPKLYKEIDFSKGFMFLDKEFEQIRMDVDAEKRYADKLVKVL